MLHGECAAKTLLNLRQPKRCSRLHEDEFDSEKPLRDVISF